MNYSEALEQLKAGRQVKCNPSGVWIEMKNGEVHEVGFNLAWEPSYEARLSDRWEARDVPVEVRTPLVD